MDTPIQKLINKLTQDANFFDGENDSRDDKIVGQYIKNVIVSDLIENYLEQERKVIIGAVKFGNSRVAIEDKEALGEKYFTDNFTNQ